MATNLPESVDSALSQAQDGEPPSKRGRSEITSQEEILGDENKEDIPSVDEAKDVSENQVEQAVPNNGTMSTPSNKIDEGADIPSGDVPKVEQAVPNSGTMSVSSDKTNDGADASTAEDRLEYASKSKVEQAVPNNGARSVSSGDVENVTEAAEKNKKLGNDTEPEVCEPDSTETAALNDVEKDVFDDDYSGESSNESDEEFRDKTEVPLEPFNLEDEKQLGHFESDGNFVWANKKNEHIDSWLANEGSQQVKSGPSRRLKSPPPPSASKRSPKADFPAQIYEISEVLQPKETVRSAIKRLSDPIGSSASARLALKKAGQSYKTESSKELHEFLELVTVFPLELNIYDKTKEDLEKLATELRMDDKMSTQDEKSDNSSEYGDDSSDSRESFTPKKRSRKISKSQYSSSDEDNDNGDDDDVVFVKEIPFSSRRATAAQNLKDFTEDIFDD